MAGRVGHTSQTFSANERVTYGLRAMSRWRVKSLKCSVLTLTVWILIMCWKKRNRHVSYEITLNVYTRLCLLLKRATKRDDDGLIASPTDKQSHHYNGRRFGYLDIPV